MTGFHIFPRLDSKPWDSELSPASKGAALLCFGLAVLLLPALCRKLGLSWPVHLALNSGAIAVMTMFLLASGQPAILSGFGFRRVSRSTLIAMPLLLLGTEVAVAAVSFGWEKLLSELAVDYNQRQYLVALIDDADWGELLLLTIAVAVIMPFFEEIVFRRVLYDLLLPLGTVSALLTTSLLFSLVHGFLAGLPGLFVLGMVFQLTYLVTRNLAAAIILHGLTNLTTVIATLYGAGT